MCSRYQGIKECERYDKQFGVMPPIDEGNLDVWPCYAANFIRRPREADVGDSRVWHETNPFNSSGHRTFLTVTLRVADALRATVRYCPVLVTEPEGGWRRSSTSLSIWVLVGCKCQRFDGGSISVIGSGQRRSCAGGFTVGQGVAGVGDQAGG